MRIIKIIMVLMLCFSVPAFALVSEVCESDGTDCTYPYSIRFPAGTTSESGGVVTYTPGAGAPHDPITLAADADTILGLSSQEIGLDTQTANTVFAGPESGAAADPTFRALVAGDIPALSYLASADIDTYAELDAIVADQTLVYSGGAFHDGFSDFFANEHIDWTTDQGATNIHAGNIPDLSGTYLTAETNALETDGASGIADTEIFVGSGAGTGTYAALSGEATMANTGAVTLSDSALDDQYLEQDAANTLGGNLDFNGYDLEKVGNITFQTGAVGGMLRTGTNAADKFQLQAYDVDDTAYVNVFQIDAGNTIGVEFNDAGHADVDIRMETDTEDHFFYLDAGSEWLRLGDWDTNYVQFTKAGVMTFVGTGSITLPDNSVDSDMYVDGSIDPEHLGTTADSYPITLTVDGGGSAITTGVKGYVEVPQACTISKATILLDQSGSIVIDIWKDTYANYPPTDADTITAGAEPTVTTATKSQDPTLTGWTKSIAAGDILGFNVDSITTATRATLILECDI